MSFLKFLLIPILMPCVRMSPEGLAGKEVCYYPAIPGYEK